MRVVTHPLIYDWNQDAAEPSQRLARVMLNDETLRDGLQSLCQGRTAKRRITGVPLTAGL